MPTTGRHLRKPSRYRTSGSAGILAAVRDPHGVSRNPIRSRAPTTTCKLSSERQHDRRARRVVSDAGEFHPGRLEIPGLRDDVAELVKPESLLPLALVGPQPPLPPHRITSV